MSQAPPRASRFYETVLTAPPVARTKPGLNINFRPSSSRSDLSISSSNPVLGKPGKFTSTKRTRQFIHLFQLVLSFTILVLAITISYCADLPHSGAVSTGSDGITGTQTNIPSSISTRGATLVAPSTTTTQPASAQSSSSDTPYVLLRTSIHVRDESVDDGNYDETSNTVPSSTIDTVPSDAKTSSTQQSKASLYFYTAFVPLLTLFYTSAVLLLTLVRSESSQNTRLGDLLLLHRVANRRRIGTLVSFMVSTILLTAWVIMQLIWTNCEIAPLSGAGSNAGVCPLQLQGHHMAGIETLSIGKVVLGWILVAAYLGYLIFLVFKVGVFRARLDGGSASARGTKKQASFGFKKGTRFARDVDNRRERY